MRQLQDLKGPLTISVGLILYCFILTWADLNDWAYIFVNVIAAVIATLLARRTLSYDDLGLHSSHARSGFFYGGAIASVVAAVAVAGSALFAGDIPTPETQQSTGDLVFDICLRIPIGTAAAEEILFRGVLLGLWTRRSRRFTKGLVATSFVFALWHVWPTLAETSDGNLSKALGDLGSLGAVVSALWAPLLVTFVAGIFFGLLRRWTGSVIAPIFVHAAANGSGLLVTYLASTP